MTEVLSLLNSSPPQFLEQVFLRVYQTRLDGVNSSLIDSVSTQLDVDEKKGTVLLETILEISKQAVYYNFSEKETILKLFKNSQMSEELKENICQILLKHIPSWRDQTIQTQVSPPKLVDMKWRIDLQTSSDSISNLVNSNLIVQMDIQKCSEKQGVMKPMETISFEMNKETLEIMLKGLGKIRDQLSSMKN
eukprot:gene6314-10321_t